MLKQITIQNLAILDDITLDFSESLNILTGETGAGKSIIIDALSLIFGARANTDLIRHGKEQAKIEALLYLSDTHCKMIQELTDIDVYDECIIQRTIYANGRSTAKINGNLIPLSQLSKIAEILIDIHSQHESQYLLKADQHLPLLHQYILSFQKDYLNEYQREFEIYLQLKKKKESLESEFENIKDIDYLNYQLQELKDVLTDEEEENIIKEYKNIQQFQKNAAIFEEVMISLDGNQKALDNLYYALKALNKLQDNEQIASYATRLESNYLDLKDLSESFKKEFDVSNFDTRRVDELQDKITYMNRLKRKYNHQHLFALKQEIIQKINSYQNFKEQMDEIEIKLEKQIKICEKLASDVTKIRESYALQLKNEIQIQLKDLYLENARFSVRFKKLNQFTKTGNDEIEFYLSANIGEPEQPLVKVASGGEVSRIMLGLKTVFCKIANLSTIIFDEIDTGVSGKVAMAMGKKMKEISKFSQVLAVTHLPQVACFGNQHLYIYKEVIDERTKTQVQHLDEKGKINEIARLLSGNKITENSISMAKELLFTNQ